MQSIIEDLGVDVAKSLLLIYRRVATALCLTLVKIASAPLRNG